MTQLNAIVILLGLLALMALGLTPTMILAEAVGALVCAAVLHNDRRR
jgi:hypothetical protein